MSVTGLFLITFLLVHLGCNACLFLSDGGLLFNEVSLFMETNIVIRIMEIVLFAGFIIHILQSIAITRQNMKARPIGYAVSSGAANSKWYSRSMGILGSLIFFFLVVHMKNFFYETHFTNHLGLDNNGVPDLYAVVKSTFEIPAYDMLYIFSCVVLAYHLLHGFQSAFRSLGVYHKKYTPLIEFLGIAYSIIVCGVFAAMPLYFLLKK